MNAMHWVHGRRRARRRRGEGGFVMVFVAMMLIVLMVFAAFTVDVGYFYSRANKAQAAADSAALAGVVYMPTNFAAATARARDVAKLNGYEHGVDGVTVDVATVPGAPRQLRVVVNDPHVKTLFGRVLMDEISITRSATGEYVGSIPLGSPTNALGTGSLTEGGTVDYNTPDVVGNAQNFWLAVSGYCTAKEDGDRFLSYYDGNRTQPNNYSCTSVTQNTEYSASGYEYIVDVPCTRTDPSVPCDPSVAYPGNLSIQVYNPWFDVSAPELRAELLANADDAIKATAPNYPDQRTLAKNPDPDADDDGTTTPAELAAYNAEVARLQQINMTTVFEILRPTSDPQIWTVDSTLEYPTCYSSAGIPVPMTAAPIYSPATPCTPEAYGGGGWVNLRTGINTAGRWKVRVYTKGVVDGSYSFGTNQFALRAAVNGLFSPCDSRDAPTTCPGVSGDSNMSIFANSSGSTAEFFLARLAPATEFQGKQVRVRLWDTGEGMQNLQLINPDGVAVTLDQVKLGNPNFSQCIGSENIDITPGGTTLDVSGDTTPGPNYGGPPYNGSFACLFPTNSRHSQAKYNDRMIEVTITLPTTYTGGAGDGWWKIRYASSTGQVADRTTWEVKLVGDPVHLRRDE